MSGAATKAVFLSYASQDAEAARRICDALRSGGVEVWFDADGGLEHGDEWDAKIRRQIKECVLFIPVVSANTQSRHEGYFRLEWELAAQRAMSIASGVPFILPVVTDDTREPDALVPDRFRVVQWTRLRGGEVPAEVLQRFLKLWSHRTGVLMHEAAHPGVAPATYVPAEGGGPVPGRFGWRVGAMAAALLLGALGWKFLYRSADSNRVSEPAPPSAPPATSAPAAATSEVRQLVAKAWEQLNTAGLARTNLEVADELCRRAVALDPNDGDVWAAWSQVDSCYIYHGLDNTVPRREGARTKAARAMQLAPNSYEARLAQACYLTREGGGQTASPFAPEAEGLLRALLREKPDEPRALLAQGILLRNTGKLAEAREVFARMAKVPAFAALAWNEIAWAEIFNGDARAAEVAADASVALQPFWGNLTLKMWIAVGWWGDLDLGKTTMDRIPAAVQQEDYGVFLRTWLYYLRHEPENMLRVLNSVPREWLQSNGFDGPKAYWAALGQQMAGHGEAAQVQWQTALKLVEQRLADQPDSEFLLHWKGVLLAASGRRTEAEKVLRVARDMGRKSFFNGDAHDQILLGNLDAATALLERAVDERARMVTAAIYRLDPRWDPIREQPRFKALLARMEADPWFSPKAPEIPAAVTPAQPVADKSVAVLAFANLSDDKANEYFSDGISEELLNVLAKVPGLKVTARTSSFFFKGNNLPIPEIAKQLGVAYVVEGSVRKQGDKVRITAQLIKAADGFHVWSDTFTRDLKDIFALQDEIAGLVAKALSLRLGAGSPATTARVNPEALRLYLEGRQMWNLRTADGLARADSLFRRALELEPNFARALSGLADLGVVRRSGSGGRLAQREEIVAQAERAIALDPTLADPHATLGLLEFTDWNFAAADTYFQRAFTLNPSYAWAHLWYGQSLMTQGRVEEAMAENQRALEADPLAPRIASNTALLLLLAGRPADALASADRTLSLMAGEPQAQTWKAEALLMLGREAEALKIVREALAIDPKRRDFTYVLARTGTPEERAAAVAAPDPRFANRTRSLLAVGREEEALAGLAADVQDSVFSFQFVLFHPAFDGVRNDPRFVKMLERLHMTDAHARAQAWRAAHPREKATVKQ